jgi:ABC-type nitrate/sulfonate/bicarbonate transport system ATPase subunit
MNYTYGDPVLTVKDLSLSFGKKLILRDINIQLKDVKRDTTTGQVITLLGPSGIGKTQFLKMIAGLQKPTTGEIKIGIKQEAPQAGKVGMVLQTYPLFEHRTVLSNLQLVSKDKERIEYLLEHFDIIQQKNKYPPQLSGGQRQRTAIVQQILSSDSFILLDEPFSGLDPLATRKLSLAIRKLADLNDENTIILSSHIFSPALAVSDTAIMLNKEKDIEGATVTGYYDLVGMGLAWYEDIRKDLRFVDLCNNIENEFFK